MLAQTTMVLLWAAAISSGLMAGIYFAFSAFIMNALNKVNTDVAITAMNSINRVIVKSWFMPLFFGSTLVSLLLIIIAVIQWGEESATLTLLAGIIYVVGMFLCTAVFNVPLNNLLDKQNPQAEDSPHVWKQYFLHWTRWNHLRTVCSVTTSVLCIVLLTLM